MTFFTLSLRSIFTIGLLYVSYAAFATISIGEVAPASAGACDGSVQVTATGDAGPFDLYISGPNDYFSFKSDLMSGQHTFTGLCSGEYTIEVINAYMCETTLNATVGCPLTFQQSVTEASCATGRGTITVTPQDGTAPYTYTWKNEDGATAGGNTATINNLPPDKYFVTITDANGCKATGDFSTKPTGENAIYPYLEEVKMYAKVGTTQTLIYQANWILTSAGCLRYIGGSNDISTQLYDAIYDGTASLSLRVKANKRLAEISVKAQSSGDILGVPSTSDQINWTFYITNPNIFQVSGNKLYQSFLFEGADEKDNLLLNLWSSSNETVECVKLPILQNDCTWVPMPPSGADEHYVELEKQCMNFIVKADYATASISIPSIEGGVTPYTFRWTKSGTEISTERFITNLSPAEYCVKVIDSQGCTVEKCVTLYESIEDKFEIEVNTSCTSNNNGKICITGDLEDLLIQWQDGTTGNCLESVGIATYCVGISDIQSGQKVVKCIDVRDYVTYVPQLALDIDRTSIPCTGSANNRVCINVTGGKAPYTYLWEDGSTNACLENAVSGRCYSVTVTDACGSMITNCFELPPAYSLPSVTNVYISDACSSGQNGSISLKISGGRLPYTYNWVGSLGFASTTKDINNLTPGVYYLTITDACGSTVTKEYSVQGIGSPVSFDITSSKVIPSCSQTDAKGKIELTTTITPAGSPLTFQWDNGATTEDLNNLLPGYYTLTITDGYGCRQLRNFQVIESPVNLMTTIDPPCQNQANGKINASLNTNYPPAFYHWSTGASGSINYFIENLAAGTYTVTATDDRGCTASKSVTLEPISFAIDASIRNACNGAIDLTVTTTPLASPVFNYNWSNNKNTEDIEGLAAGTYFVTVSNAKGCQASSNFNILDEFEPPIIAVAGVQNATNPSTQDGAIDIGILNMPFIYGPPLYEATWSTGQSRQFGRNFGVGNEDIQNLRPGWYTVTVTDNRGCQDIENIQVGTCTDGTEIPNPIPFTLDAVVTPISSSGGSDGALELLIQGGSGLPYYYEWTATYSSATGFDKAYSASISNLSENEYCVTVTDGCYTASLCRKVVFCEDYTSNSSYGLDITYNLDQPCNYKGANNNDLLGGIFVNPRYPSSIYGQPNYKWEYRYYDGNWYDFPNGTLNSIITQYAGYFKVFVSDLTTCVREHTIYLPEGIINNSKGVSEDYKTCNVEVRCNGRCIKCETKNTEIKFINNPFVPCEGVIVCPINNEELRATSGIVMGSPVIKEESFLYPGYCRATATCKFEEIGVTINHDFLTPGICNNPPSGGGGYGVGDADGDGTLDKDDKCPTISGPIATKGCPCEGIGSNLDSDSDGINDSCDNCPFHYNPSQSDNLDDNGKDGVGDACDFCPNNNSNDPIAAWTDTDGDGIFDGCDNCKNADNPNQCDRDADGKGDICDALDECDLVDENFCCIVRVLKDNNEETELLSDTRYSLTTESIRGSFAINKIFPNPFKNSFSIDINSVLDQEVDIIVLSMLGTPVVRQIEKLVKGKNLVQIAFPDSNSAGMYQVKVRDREGNEVNNLVVHIN